MNISYDLFLLIKSMTPSDKKGFIIYSKATNKAKLPNHLRLFDCLNKQKVYDHKKIKNACEKKGS